MYSHPYMLAGPARNPALFDSRERARDGEVPAAASAKQSLLLAIDDTDASASAVAHVLANKDPRTTTVHLIHVENIAMPRDLTRSIRKFIVARRRTESERIIHAARKLLEAGAFECSDEIAHGDVAEAIVLSAARRLCTGIVMGMRAGGVIARLFGRSVSARVVKHAPVPVTLVKQPGDDRLQSISQSAAAAST